MKSQTNFQGEVSILRQSCFSMEKDLERKIQQTKNIIKQTTLNLQKLEVFQPSVNIVKPVEPALRKSSINQHSDMQSDCDTKCSSQNDLTKTLESSIFQSLSQNPSNFNIQSGLQDENNSVSFSDIMQESLSSKCSILMDTKTQENSKESENSQMDQEEIQIDGTNELEKRIHQWLDNQGIKMVSPCKKHDDYFEQKRSQILIMHKKKQNPMSSYQINNDEPLSAISKSPSKFMTTSLNVKQLNSKSENLQKIASKQAESKVASEIMINSLFNTSITDSPLMQRRKLMLQNAQESDPSQFTQGKKARNFTTLQLNSANSGVKSSLAHLSQYKRSSPTKSNNEIVSSDISTDCK